MKIATWNVNGIRARREQFLDWLVEESPDIVCLQEIKVGLDKLPADLANLAGWHSCWHGEGGYSGVALLVREDFPLEQPVFSIPSFDFEHRALIADVGELRIASLYVPNGGKSFDDKTKFLDELQLWTREQLASGRSLILAGDLNITLEDRDVHPKDRKANSMGQRPEERRALADLIDLGLVDLGRRHAPDDESLFTWWPPWRKRRERNIGWRIDYLLADRQLAESSVSSRSARETGTSDHAPVTASFIR